MEGPAAPPQRRPVRIHVEVSLHKIRLLLRAVDLRKPFAAGSELAQNEAWRRVAEDVWHAGGAHFNVRDKFEELVAIPEKEQNQLSGFDIEMLQRLARLSREYKRCAPVGESVCVTKHSSRMIPDLDEQDAVGALDRAEVDNVLEELLRGERDHGAMVNGPNNVSATRGTDGSSSRVRRPVVRYGDPEGCGTVMNRECSAGEKVSATSKSRHTRPAPPPRRQNFVVFDPEVDPPFLYGVIELKPHKEVDKKKKASIWGDVLEQVKKSNPKCSLGDPRQRFNQLLKLLGRPESEIEHQMLRCALHSYIHSLPPHQRTPAMLHFVRALTGGCPKPSPRLLPESSVRESGAGIEPDDPEAIRPAKRLKQHPILQDASTPLVDPPPTPTPSQDFEKEFMRKALHVIEERDRHIKEELVMLSNYRPQLDFGNSLRALLDKWYGS